MCMHQVLGECFSRCCLALSSVFSGTDSVTDLWWGPGRWDGGGHPVDVVHLTGEESEGRAMIKHMERKGEKDDAGEEI